MNENINKQDGSLLDRYKIAVDLLMYEGEMLWQIMNTFMVANTIYVGFVAMSFDAELAFKACNPTYMVVAIVGLLISFAWRGTFKRNSNYYKFRMAQVKEFEPSDTRLFGRKGYLFAEGRKVKIGRHTYQNKCLANFMRNKRAGNILIWTFIGIYLLLLLSSINFCGQ